MHTRSSPNAFVAMELPQFTRGTKVSPPANEANKDKENHPPSPSPIQSAAEHNSSIHLAGRKFRGVADVTANEEPVISNIAERAKRNRRNATKSYVQASPTMDTATSSAPSPNAALALAAFSGATAPPPSPSAPFLPHTDGTLLAPLPAPKRTASTAFDGPPPSKAKRPNQWTSGKQRLSDTPKAVHAREQRAAKKAALSAASPQLTTNQQPLSRLRELLPRPVPQVMMSSELSTSSQKTSKPELSQTASAIASRAKRAKWPKRRLSDTKNAILKRRKRRADKASQTVAVSNSGELQPDPEQSSPKPSESGAVSHEASEQIAVAPRKLPARAARAQTLVEPSPDAAESDDERLPTRLGHGFLTSPARAGVQPLSLRASIQYQDIVKYSRPGEDLDWSKVKDPKKRKRMQNVISSRKHLAKKKMEQAATPQNADPSDKTTDGEGDLCASLKSAPAADAASSPSTGSRRLRGRPQNALDTSTPRSAQKLPLPTSTPVHRIELSTQSPAHRLARIEALRLSNSDFVQATKEVLAATGKSGGKSLTFAVKQARRLLTLLNVAEPPKPDEAHFLSGAQASKYLEANNYFSGPIFTTNQQTLPLQTVEQFLSECYDDDVVVYVQDSGMRVAQNTPHVRARTMADVKKRFAKPPTDTPWNLLELAAHCEDGLRPAFLNTEDCRLLTKLKFPSSADKASRKGYDPGWKEVEKWALVAQAGALTEPHQDSHGYSTYITVNQGIFGYGWLSNPTNKEREQWSQSHHSFIGGQWRYVILRPGQTVYFPCGTIHFVFRLPAAGNTLAFGGHVLRCSQIVRWIKTLIEEKAAPDITNEDLTVSAPGYLDRVEKFVRQAMQMGQEEKWGGKDAIQEFLRLKVEFESMKTRV